MNRTLLLPAAWLLDQIAGDPEWIPHPVRLMGLAITRGESAIRRKDQSKGTELITGAALTIALVASSYFLSRQAIRFANRHSRALGDAIELLLSWTCLAARSLEQEATNVFLQCGEHRRLRIQEKRARSLEVGSSYSQGQADHG